MKNEAGRGRARKLKDKCVGWARWPVRHGSRIRRQRRQLRRTVRVWSKEHGSMWDTKAKRSGKQVGERVE